MIKSLYTIGKSIQHLYPEYYKPWTNPYPNNETNTNVIIINIEAKEIIYPIVLEKIKTDSADKVLYRKVQGANGTNIVPTFLYYADGNEDKQKENIRKVIKKIKASLKNYKHDFFDISSINEKLSEKLFELPLNKDERYLLTFKINGKFFGEYPKYKELFESEAYKKYSKDSSSKGKICSVTYEKSDIVWGRVDTLGFTVYDKTFNRNGFNGKDSYKMFPVSPEAVKILEGTRQFVLDKLSRNFYGMKYFILPHFINPNEELIKEVIAQIFVKDTETKGSANPLNEKSILGTENFLNDIIEDDRLSRGDIYYDIFFYQPNNAQFLIKLHVADVLPSRLKEIIETKKEIENKYKNLNEIYIPKKGKKEAATIHYYITFGRIKDFFSKKVKTETVFHNSFFRILEAVFHNNSLNQKQIITHFFKKIQIDFKNRSENKYAWIQRTKESFTLYQFFANLNLFKNVSPMKDININRTKMNYQEFINDHTNFFERNKYKEGVFALGCAVEKLLEKQRNKFGNEPFLKHLNGLNINEKTIQKIVPKLVEKIGYYKNENEKNSKIYPNEERYINSLLAKSGDAILTNDYGISRTEISYVFTMGMIMQKEFTKSNIQENVEKKNEL